MSLIDTHFHLDLMLDPRACIAKIEQAQVYTIAVTNAPSVFFHTKELTNGRKFVKPALGLHPELAFQRYGEMLLFEKELDKTRYIGEVGLDKLKKSSEDYSKQKTVFEQILRLCAGHGDKILTVHSRWAATDVIGMIGDKFPGKVILHWFSGTIRELESAAMKGMYFSVNFAMTQSENGRKIINAIPSDRLLTESDGPFAKIDNTEGAPWNMNRTITAVADVQGKATEDVSRIVFENFKAIIS